MVSLLRTGFTVTLLWISVILVLISQVTPAEVKPIYMNKLTNDRRSPSDSSYLTADNDYNSYMDNYGMGNYPSSRSSSRDYQSRNNNGGYGADLNYRNQQSRREQNSMMMGMNTYNKYSNPYSPSRYSRKV